MIFTHLAPGRYVVALWSASPAPRREASRPHLLSRPLGVAVVADHRRRARRAVCQEAQARRLHRHRERDRGALRRQPDRRARCAAHACRRSASPRSGWARAAARASRAAIRGCSPRRWRCSSTSPASAPPRSWTRSAPSNASPPSLPPRTPPTPTSRGCGSLIADAEASHRRRRALHRARRGIPSRRRRGLAQPRAGGAAHLAAARVVAAAQSDADAEGRAPHPRRSQGAARR